MALKYRKSRLHYYQESYKEALNLANEVFAKALKQRNPWIYRP